jgi:hypothetical protein
MLLLPGQRLRAALAIGGYRPAFDLPSSSLPGMFVLSTWDSALLGGFALQSVSLQPDSISQWLGQLT